MRARAFLTAVAMAVTAASAGLAAPADASAADIAVLMRTTDTSGWPSSDPSGIAFDSAADRLVVVDGEIEEADMAWLWAGYNGYIATRDGALTGTFNTTTASPTNKEPVGVGYDPARDELYISKDGSNSQIWVYARGGGGAFTTVVRQFAIGDKDAEGVAFGGGTLYVSDGSHRRIWTFAPGNDGVVGTGDDPAATSFDVGTLGQRDPEGLEYDTATGHLWAVSRNDNPELLEVTVSGAVVRRFNLGFLNTRSLSGVAIGPASDGSSTRHLYISDRGEDNAANPNQNDGRIYEVAIQDGGDPPPPPEGNLIVNGGFESASATGAPTAWTEDPRFRQSADAFVEGSFSGRHQATDNGAYQLVQNVAVVGGTSYQVSTQLNVPPTSDAFTFILRVQWRGSSGKIGVADVAKLKTSTSGWTQFTKTLVAPSGATQARLMMIVKSLNTTIYIDDVILGS